MTGIRPYTPTRHLDEPSPLAMSLFICQLLFTNSPITQFGIAGFVRWPCTSSPYLFSCFLWEGHTGESGSTAKATAKHSLTWATPRSSAHASLSIFIPAQLAAMTMFDSFPRGCTVEDRKWRRTSTRRWWWQCSGNKEWLVVPTERSTSPVSVFRVHAWQALYLPCLLLVFRLLASPGSGSWDAVALKQHYF